MTHSAPPTPHARDGALRRLRGLTIGAAGTALGAVAVFAGIAAATVPGHSGAAAQAGAAATSGSSTSSPTDTASATDSGSGLQTSSPPQASSASGSSHAATGGS